MLRRLIVVRAVAYHFGQTVFGVIAIAIFMLLDLTTEGIVAVMDAFIVSYPVVPLAKLPLVQQLARIVNNISKALCCYKIAYVSTNPIYME
ncbi:hypothetical protein ABRZ28_23315 [Brenneria sp. g21c3]|uniref:hypothetical protein n=1 Tax=Brenneria sp. g21c3 TaxID=3093893 RepID=UPI0032EB9346